MNRSHELRGLSPLLLASLLALSGSPGRAEEQAPSPIQTQPKAPKGENGRARAEGVEAPAGHTPELRDETFRLMDAYLISNLQESLGLTDEQFARAMPLVKKLQSDRRNFARRRMQALRLLRKTLVSGAATEAGVAELLKEVKGASAEERAATVRNMDVLDAALSPLQQAKFLVFEAEVDVRLRHLLARSRDKDRQPSR